MKPRLIYKLLTVNLVVIAFVMIVVWVSVDTLAAGYFVTLMEKYNISPEPAHAMFVSAVHRYLIWASLAAVTLAAALSFVMMRRVLAPLTRMTVTTRDIASGNFAVRVPAQGGDEVGELARAFNRMAAGLEKLEGLRRTLMIDVAHELRTPLTNIRGYLEALADRVLPASEETLSLLQEETMRLALLVEDVLELARADAARGDLQCEATDLKAAVADALAFHSRAFAEKKIAVTFHPVKTPATLPVDRRRISRVLRNLSDNAARYTPPNGRLDVRIEAGPAGLRVEYRNTAEGLAAGDLPFLFERFYRGEKSRSRRHGGAGIGLAIVKELVEAHGGRVGAGLAGGRVSIWFELPPAPGVPAA